MEKFIFYIQTSKKKEVWDWSVLCLKILSYGDHDRTSAFFGGFDFWDVSFFFKKS